MSNLVCIRHPKYQGKESPVLSCKTCCAIFIAEIKSRQPSEDINEWLDRKVREARGYNPSK